MPRWSRLPLFLLALLGVALPARPVAGQVETAAYRSSRLAGPEEAFAAGRLVEARELWTALLAATDLDPAQLDYARLRLADCAWRTVPADAPDTERTRWRTELEQWLAHPPGPAPRPEDWAWLAEESLGDFALQGEGDWDRASTHYRAALEGWAASRDTEVARRRFLDILWRVADWANPGQPFGAGPFAERLPLRDLENAHRIALSGADQARAHLLLARAQTRGEGRTQGAARVSEEFAAAVLAAAGTDFLDDALWSHALWASRGGRSSFDERGDPQFEPDYGVALALARRLVDEFGVGGSPFTPAAQAMIEDILRIELAVSNPHSFQPGAEILFSCQVRNLERVQLRLLQLDLPSDLPASGASPDPAGWLDQVALENRVPVWQNAFSATPRQPHGPTRLEVRLEQDLHPGLYAVEASAEDRRACALLLVTDQALLVRASPGRLTAFAADAITGAPLAEARLFAWWRDSQGAWKRTEASTDAVGLASWEGPAGGAADGFLVGGMSLTGRPLLTWMVPTAPATEVAESHRLLAWTNRATARPGETLPWELVLRRADPGAWVVPEPSPAAVRLVGPDQRVVAQQPATLDEFGAASGQWALPARMAPGAYRVEIGAAEGGTTWASAPLLRVLAETNPVLAVRLDLDPLVPGALAHQAGETIRGAIQASDLFGNPAASAEVTLRIWRRLWPATPPQAGEWDWLFGPDRPGAAPGPETLLLELPLRADLQGRAEFSFETEDHLESDAAYRVEASVHDLQGRRQEASASLRVGRQEYYAWLEPRQRLHRPEEEAEILLRTAEVDGQPRLAQGVLRLTREVWKEVWVDRRGREITGQALRELKRKSGGWFSFGPTAADYALKSEGYEAEEVLVQPVSTHPAGEFVFRHRPAADGFYRLTFLGRDRLNQTVKADCAFWVGREGESDLGFRSAGVQLITGHDRVRPGQPVPILLTVPGPDRHVLLTRGTGSQQRTEVVRLEGTSHLLELEADPAAAPILPLTAEMIADQAVSHDRRGIWIPPVDRFLQVRLVAAADGYLPRDRALVRVEVRDAQGQPVADARVTLALFPAVPPGAADRPGLRRRFLPPWPPLPPTGESSLATLPYYQPIARRGPRVPDSMRDLWVGPGAAEWPRPGSAPEGALPEDRPAGPEFPALEAWQSALRTDSQGWAQGEVTMPDTLGSWQLVAGALTRDGRVGEAGQATFTRQPFTARLIAPTDLFVGDRARVFLELRNNREIPVELSLAWPDHQGWQWAEAPSVCALGPGEMGTLAWNAQALDGEFARLALRVEGEDFVQALTQVTRLRPHRPERLRVAAAAPGGDLRTGFELPASADPATIRGRAWVTPSLIGATCSILAQLAESREETLERAAARLILGVALGRAAREMGLALPQDHLASPGHPSWPALLQLLQERQGETGLWSSEEGFPIDPELSALATWALTECSRAGLAVDPIRLDHARAGLGRLLFGSETPAEVRTVLLYGLAAAQVGRRDPRPDRLEARAFLQLLRDRATLSDRGLALLLGAAHRFQFEEEVRLLVPELARRARLAGTAPGEEPAARMLGSTQPGEFGPARALGATAAALLSLVEGDPDQELLQPLLLWLIRQRHVPGWEHPREALLAGLAFCALAQSTGELQAQLSFTSTFNRRPAGEGRVSLGAVLRLAEPTFLPPGTLNPGGNLWEITRTGGSGPVYAWAEIAFAGPVPAPAAPADGLSLERTYFRIAARPTLLRGPREELEPLPPGQPLPPGDRLVVALELTAERAWPEVWLEDGWPSGFEPFSWPGLGERRLRQLEAPAGSPTAAPPSWREHLGEGGASWHLSELPAGRWEIRYALRAGLPGRFLAPAASARVLAAPEIRARSAEQVMLVQESSPSSP